MTDVNRREAIAVLSAPGSIVRINHKRLYKDANGVHWDAAGRVRCKCGNPTDDAPSPCCGA